MYFNTQEEIITKIAKSLEEGLILRKTFTRCERGIKKEIRLICEFILYDL